MDVDGGWRAAIVRGELLLLVRMRGADASCTVELLRGGLPLGASALAVDDRGRPLPDQTIDILASSLADGFAIDRYDETEVRDGRLRTVSRPPLNVPLFIGGASADLPILDSQVRFDLFRAAPQRGLIAGAPEVSAVTETALTLLPDIDDALIRMVIEGQSDLAPDEHGECQRVSVGLVFETIPVTLGVVR